MELSYIKLKMHRKKRINKKWLKKYYGYSPFYAWIKKREVTNGH